MLIYTIGAYRTHTLVDFHFILIIFFLCNIHIILILNILFLFYTSINLGN